MNFKILLSIIYLTSTVVFYAPIASAATMEECRNQAQKSLDNAKSILGADQITEFSGANMVSNSIDGVSIADPAAKLRDYAAQNAVNKANARNAIAQELAQCQQACSNPVEEQLPQGTADEQAFLDKGRKACEDTLNPVIAQLEQASNDSVQAAHDANATHEGARDQSGGGGMSPMMAGLLGAALGAGAAMLLNKDKDKDKEKKKEETPENEDGSVNCSVAGAEIYSDCNEHFVKKCEGNFGSEECKSFSTRYCTAGSGGATDQSNNSTPATSNSGIIIASAEDKDIKGEGMGSNYCFNFQATSYCATAGRETCPSCLQLETNKAEACKANPTLCMAQNSLAEIEAAKQTCPSDPMFSNPDYVAGGGSTVPNADSLSTPILPDYYSSSEGFTNAADAYTPPPSPDSHSVIGYSVGDEVAGNGSSQNSYSAGGTGSSELGQGGSGVALPNPVLPAAGIASASQKRSPTSAGGEMGPSLFSMSSAIIESRCKSRQLAHCLK